MSDMLENNWGSFMDALMKQYPPLSQGNVMRELARQVDYNGRSADNQSERTQP
jgi:hypothetical protein